MTSSAEAVRRRVEELIVYGSNYQVEELERIYHRDLRIVKIDERSNVSAIGREQNLALFRARQEALEAPLSTAAEFNYVEADARNGHVIVTRRMQLGDRPEKSVFSLHLVKDDGRWQVVRETVFVRPLEEGREGLRTA